MADQYDRRASARRQALLALLSGTVAEPAAGLAGLYGLATGGVNKGAHNVEATRDALTYHPRDASALEAVGRAVEPVTGRLQKLRDYLGDKTMAHTGSPALATAGYMVPDTLLTLLGARGMGVKGPNLSQVAERSAADNAMGSMQAQAGNIGHWMRSPQAQQMTREQFLGSPKITKNSNSAELKPRALSFLDGVAPEPINIGGQTYLAKYSPDGAAIFDGDKVIASYNFGDTLAVDKAYRKQGIGKELVYEWRTRHPAPAATKYRTKASQAIQEQVWDRIQRESGGY